MRKQVRSKLMDTAHAQQPHPVEGFALEDLQGTCGAGSAGSAESVQRCASHPHGAGAECKCLEHVGAAADAAGHVERDPVIDDVARNGQEIEWRNGPVELSATMATQHDAVDAAIHGAPYILGIEDSLQDERLFPELPNPCDRIPAERSRLMPANPVGGRKQ